MTKMLFLHGTGGRGNPETEWLPGLNECLAREGFPRISEVDLIAPDYCHALDYPPLSDTKSLPRIEPKLDYDARATFLRRRDAIAERLRRVDGRPGAHIHDVVPDPVVDHIADKLQKRAYTYAHDQKVRHSILTQVSYTLPKDEPVLIVGHSLGSVVAVDLLSHLDDSHHIAGLVTLGSPLGVSGALRKDSSPLRKEFPYSLIQYWVNVFDPFDPVTGLTGVSGKYEDALDVAIDIRNHIGPIVHTHAMNSYAVHDVTAHAIGEAFHGHGAMVHAGGALAKNISSQYFNILLQFAYAQALTGAIDPKDEERRRQLREARDVVADRAVAQWEKSVADLEEQLAAEVNYTDQFQRIRDLLDETKSHPTRTELVDHPHSAIRGRLTDAELCERLLPLISYLPMPPFEVETDPSDKRIEGALNGLFAQVRQSDGYAKPLLSQDFARMAIEARKVGRDAMADGRKVRWQWIALGGGVALLALTGVGLAFAVPTGLAGAAAITATLAAFGPGGMVGGMATIAALTGTGIAAAAAGATTAKSTHETVKQLTAALAEAEPEQLRSLLATTIGVVELKRKIGIDPQVDGLIHVLVDARSQISHDEQTHRLVEGRKSQFVADSSVRIKHLNRAIEWLSELLPAAVTGGEGVAGPQ